MRKVVLVLAAAAALAAGLIQLLPGASTAAGIGNLRCDARIVEGPLTRDYQFHLVQGTPLQSANGDVNIPLFGRQVTTGAGLQGQAKFNAQATGPAAREVTLYYQSFDPGAVAGPDPKVIQTSGLLILDLDTLAGISGSVLHTLASGAVITGTAQVTSFACTPVVDP